MTDTELTPTEHQDATVEGQDTTSAFETEQHDTASETKAALEPSFETPDDAAVPLVSTADLPLGVNLTLPRPGASPLQERLAGANATARSAALGRLATWFPGYDFEEAAQNVDARRFCVLTLDDQLLDHLGGEDMVDRLLFDHLFNFGLGGVSFSHGDVKGHQPPPPYARRASRSANTGWLVPGGLARALDERWTAIINAADQSSPPLREVCLAFNTVYASPVQTNIYISYGPSKGFGAHWDNHDTIIVPLRGQKRWSLFEPALLSPELPWNGPEVSDKPVWDGVIEPGIALIIPRGWGHKVEGSDDLSIHCTIGVNRIEVHNLLERVSFEAGFWPALRADVPFDVRQEVVSYGGSVFDDPHGFVRAVGEVMRPDLVERALAAHRARIVRLQPRRFRDTFRAVAHNDWSGLTIRLTAAAGVMLAAESDNDVVVAFDDRAVRVAAEAVDAFVAVADCQPWSLEDLPPVGEGEDRRGEFARLLVTCGLAAVEERRAVGTVT